MLSVPIYILNQEAEEEVLGEYRLVNGEVVPLPEDSIGLRRLLQTHPVGPDPEAWMRNLCNVVRGTYLYAGRAKEV